jgi:hypothetical protein
MGIKTFLSLEGADSKAVSLAGNDLGHSVKPSAVAPEVTAGGFMLDAPN